MNLSDELSEDGPVIEQSKVKRIQNSNFQYESEYKYISNAFQKYPISENIRPEFRLMADP